MFTKGIIVCTKFTHYGNNTLFLRPIDVAQQVWKNKGAVGFFKGLVATLGREVPANAIYFSVYEYTKGALVPQGGTKEDLGSGSLLLAGGMAGLMFWGTVCIMYRKIPTYSICISGISS